MHKLFQLSKTYSNLREKKKIIQYVPVLKWPRNKVGKASGFYGSLAKYVDSTVQ